MVVVDDPTDIDDPEPWAAFGIDRVEIFGESQIGPVLEKRDDRDVAKAALLQPPCAPAR